jgi:hypothetical protein
MNRFGLSDVKSGAVTNDSPAVARAAWLTPAILLAVLMAAAGLAWATHATVFGPQVYTRAKGTPVAVKKTFRVEAPSGRYSLRVTNRGVTSAVITLNGSVILGPKDFTHVHGHPWRDEDWRRHLDRNHDDVHGGDGDTKGGGRDTDKDGDWRRHGRGHDHEAAVPFLRRPVTLRAGINEIVVELRGVPKTWLSVAIVSDAARDTTAPTITGVPTPTPNAAGWNNTDVTVTFSCADNVAVASCSAPVVVSTEGAGQVVSGTATDTAGNTAMTSVSLNVDKTKPTVSVALSPDPGPDGLRDLPVTAHFVCVDSGSGIASCPADIVVSAGGENQTVTGTATDVAGNTASVTSEPFSTPQVQGTASLGAAIAGAEVMMVDAAGNTASGTTASDGTFVLDTSGLTPPFLVRIVTAIASGAFPAGTTLYSVSADPNRSTRINVSVLTDLIVRSFYAAQGIDVADAFVIPTGDNAPPSPVAVRALANLVIPAVQLWLDNAGVTATGEAPADDAVNLISSPFIAYPPGVTPTSGLDVILHAIVSEEVNPDGSVAEITIAGDGVTEIISPQYQNGLIVLNTTTTNASGGGSSGSFSGLALTGDLVPILNGINAALEGFTNTVNTKGSALTAADLLPHYAPDYLHDGVNAEEDASEAADELAGVNMTAEVVGILSLDNGVAHVRAKFFFSFGTETDSGQDELALKEINGAWVLYGNQRIGDVGVNVQARRSQGAASVGPGVFGGTFAFAGANAPAGVVTAATVTGPMNNPGANIWGGAQSKALFKGLQFLDNGVLQDEFFLLSDSLGATIAAVNTKVPAGSTFTFALTTSGGTAQYTTQSNAITTETIEFSGLPASSLATKLPAVLGSTKTYSFNLPATYAISGVFLFGRVSDGQRQCSFGADGPLSLNFSTHTGSGTITIPANMQYCGFNTAITFVNVFLEVEGVNGETSFVHLGYPY